MDKRLAGLLGAAAALTAAKRRPSRGARAIDRGRAGGKLSGASRSGPQCLGGTHGGRRAARQGAGKR